MRIEFLLDEEYEQLEKWSSDFELSDHLAATYRYLALAYGSLVQLRGSGDFAPHSKDSRSAIRDVESKVSDSMDAIGIAALRRIRAGDYEGFRRIRYRKDVVVDRGY